NPTALSAENLTTGATEYEEHCAFCHGGAKAKISPMRDKFSPPVPQLLDRIPHDDDAWLFWVTKHGVRMTGMPAWGGVMSDDEIWKIVSFIKNSDRLPPEAQAAWQKMAATPGEIEEHTPEQHEHQVAPQ
ncbi:MAG: cytochrome c, partial [Pseudolysinimonas sp.]